ncbi:MAG: hypothetical protein WDM76_17085 [Limisphaerales bacterium]
MVAIRERFGWMGSHSGYDQLYEHWNAVARTPLISVRRQHHRGYSRVWGMAGKFFDRARIGEWYDLSSVIAELHARCRSWPQSRRLLHYTYLENQLGSFCPKSRPGHPVVATCHQPVSWWKQHHTPNHQLHQLDAMIVLSTAARDFF